MQFDIDKVDPGNIYKLLTATVVPRPIAWITTIDANGVVNAAPYSFFNTIGDKPPMVALGMMRRTDGNLKDTVQNIADSGEFVVNLVPFALAEAMNATAIDAPPGLSELDLAGLTTQPSSLIRPPRIAESPVSFECVTHTMMDTGPSQCLVLGRIVCIHVADAFVLDAARCHVDTRALDLIGRTVGSGYSTTRDSFQMDRPIWPPEKTSQPA